MNERFRKARPETLAQRRADEQLAATMIHQLLTLEAEGIPFPDGWRDVRPMTLSYLNSVLTGALDWKAAHG